jgi:protein-S-isoprenylcysteine O-methyltransferase Ste14
VRPDVAIYILWSVWGATWIAAALWANRTVKRQSVGREWPYRILTLAGFIFLLATAGRYSHDQMAFDPYILPFSKSLWRTPPLLAWAMVAVVAAGFAFAWWARLYLGRLWSGSITRKEGHRIVDTGPYAFVRHPIYTGIIVSAFATAAVTAMPRAVVGAVLLLVGYWLKARLEEGFLRAELGAQAYDAYALKTAMLIPLVKI